MNAAKYVLKYAFKYSNDKKKWQEFFDDMTVEEVFKTCYEDIEKEANMRAEKKIKERLKDLIYKMELLEE